MLVKNDHTKDYKSLPQIPMGEIYFLRRYNYHDSVLSGLARYQGGIVYFDCVYDVYTDEAFDGIENPQDEHGARHYTLHPLTEKQAREDQERYDLFAQYVGNHCNYHNGTIRRIPQEEVVMHPRSMWDMFYKGEGATPLSFRYTEIPAIGWFAL